MSKLTAIAMAMVLGSAASMQAATPVEMHGALSVSGTKMVDAKGAPVALRGMSMFWSGWAGQFYNRRAIHWLAYDWKADVVRAAMGVEGGGNYLDSAGKGAEANIRRVDSVVQVAVDLGIYVIIDWHDHNAPDHQAQAIAFFQRMASKWGAYPNVLYEIYNEPHGAMAEDPVSGAPAEVAWTWAQVKTYSTAVIDSIRAIDPDNIILVGTTNWAQDVDVASRSPITGRANLMYTLHFYAGSHGVSLRNRAETALAKIPLFITEWGTSNADGGGGEDRTLYWAESVLWLDWAATKGLSWCNWSIVAKDEVSAALMPGASPKGWWPDSMLSESGWYVRDRLRAKAEAWDVAVPLPDSLLADTASLPGFVQAEGFVAQKGVETESGADLDATDDIGWIENGDWTEYVVRAPEAGSWYVSARVAGKGLGGSLVVSIDGTPAETLQVAPTGGWQTWVTVVSDRPVDVAQGLHRVRLDYVGTGTTSLYNVNWIEFSPTADAVGPRLSRNSPLRWMREVGNWRLQGDVRPTDRFVLRDSRGRILDQGVVGSGLLRIEGAGSGLVMLELSRDGRRRVLPGVLLR